MREFDSHLAVLYFFKTERQQILILFSGCPSVVYNFAKIYILQQVNKTLLHFFLQNTKILKTSNGWHKLCHLIGANNFKTF